MFSIGDKVIYKHSGVYTVDAIETPSFVKDSSVLYYRLSHTFSNAKETVYVPCDSDCTVRLITEKSVFLSLLNDTKNTEVSPFLARQPQMIAEHYKNILSDNTLLSALKVMKELLIREKECDESGKKLRQAEGHYLNLTEKSLCEEYCVASDLIDFLNTSPTAFHAVGK